MISELMPRGYDNMFFALFGVTNRAVSDQRPCKLSFIIDQSLSKSSVIGPNVIQAIINTTRNNWMGFPFLFAMCTTAMIAIGFVDIEKGREDCRRFTEQRRVDRVVSEVGLGPDAIANGKMPVGTITTTEDSIS